MEKKKKSRIPWRKVIIFWLLSWLVVGAIAGLTMEYFQNMRAHRTLREGKDLLLTLRMVGTEYYARGLDPANEKRVSGLRKEAEEEVRKLSQAEGDFRILKWKESGYAVAELEYRNGDYGVVYREKKDGSYTWMVFKVKELLNLSSEGRQVADEADS